MNGWAWWAQGSLPELLDDSPGPLFPAILSFLPRSRCLVGFPRGKGGICWIQDFQELDPPIAQLCWKLGKLVQCSLSKHSLEIPWILALFPVEKSPTLFSGLLGGAEGERGTCRGRAQAA